jgi:hypothetical protein
MSDTLSQVLMVVGGLMIVSIVIAIIGLVSIWRSIRNLNIPPEADFFTTMRHVPLLLAVFLDLLDFGLDFFSAPAMWILLDRMGLPNLRNKATIEALIPLTNAIPTFTISWILVRVLNLGDPYVFERFQAYSQAFQDYQDYRGNAPRSSRSRSHSNVIDADDYR